MKLIFTLLFSLFVVASFAQTEVKGTITDAETNKPVLGASVSIKGKLTGTISDAEGRFSFKTAVEYPFTLVVSMIGYDRQEISVTSAGAVDVALKTGSELLQQVVVSASRVEENILKSPVSIEKMDIRQIQQSPSVSFYDALLNVKSLDMITSGLTYKQINTRGFNSTGNSRFLQLIDGMDNQSPGLGFSVGNLFGLADLDVESVELIPGAASALYGPVAFNGLLMTRTKSPFDYQGLSVQTKFGVNHIGDDAVGVKPFTDLAVRYAKAFNNRFAFKVNAGYLKGTDWYAQDYTDIDPNTPANLRGSNNPGRNALNIYGDEVAQTIDGIGRVSRTGYEEKDLMEYDIFSLKLGGALHYKITEGLEAIYAVNFNEGVGNYTGSSRFCLKNFNLVQNRLELRGSRFFIRAYSTAEESTDAYNSRSLGQWINRAWVRDLSGNVVASNQADATWFTRYTAAFKGQVNGITGQDHSAARAFADQGRLLPGTSEFETQKQKYIDTKGLQGAGVLSNSKLYHVDAQYDLSDLFKVVNVLVGGSYRKYDMETKGTLFEDLENKVRVNEYGVFLQATKALISDKLKLTASARYDKNENFAGSFTPRASAVFSPSEKHHFRASYQTGFRNPTVPDQFIKLNVGPIIILGGAPANSVGTGAYENSFTAASVGAFASGFSADLAKGVAFPTAVANNKDKLVKSNVPYIKPEQTTGFEIGYKGLFGNKLLLDVNYYHSNYTNFLINQVVIKPKNNQVLNSDGSINIAAAQDILGGNTQAYQLYTNAADKVAAQGATLGLTYFLPANYRVGFNTTWSDFNILDANPNNIPAFNTPKWKTNLTVGNAKLTERLGFNIAWHWQTAFDWYGTFNENRPGKIPAYSVIDAQVSYRLPSLKTTVKLGGNNIGNTYIAQAYGSPGVGALYYVSLVFDELFR